MKTRLISRDLIVLASRETLLPSVGSEELLSVSGIKNGNKNVSREIKGTLKQVLEEAPALLSPRCVVKTCPVSSIEKDRVMLAYGQSFQGKSLGNLLEGSSSIFISCVTIGSKLEEEVSALLQEKCFLKAYLLDAFGSVIVQKASKRVESLISDEARLQNLNTSVALSPGDFGWPLNEQKMIFNLVSAEKIDVELTDSFVMIPLKSITFIVGLGELVRQRHEPSCLYCTRRESCLFKEAC
jgi:hypothetical protein